MGLAGRRRRHVLILYALVVAACSRSPEAPRQLHAWLSQHRIAEPRLSGDEAHGTCERIEDDLFPIVRCGGVPAAGSEAFGKLTRLARELRAADGDADSLRWQGLWHLTWSAMPGAAAKAADRLEAARRRRPDDVRILVDLAAAHLLRAADEEEADAAATALGLTDHALELDATNRRALFNRALAMQALRLHEEAAATWRRYLELEEDPAWAREAEERIAALTPPVADAWRRTSDEIDSAVAAGDLDRVRAGVDAFRQQARQRAETLLGGWGVAILEQKTERAQRLLATSRAIGEALHGLNGEALVADTVAAIEGAQPRRRRAMASGFALFLASEAADPRELLATYRQAEKELVAAGNPSYLTVRLARARLLYQQARYAESLRLLGSIRERCAARSYHHLAARADWIEASNLLRTDSPRRALGNYRRALHTFERQGERDHFGLLHALMGETYDSLGRSREAWHHYLTGLDGYRRGLSDETLFAVANFLGDFTLRSDRIPLSLYYQNLAVASALRTGDGYRASDALLWRGLLHHLLGEPVLAEADLGRAALQAATIPGDELRQGAEIRIRLVRGWLWTSDDPQRARRDLSAVLAHYETRQDRVYQLLALESRAEANWRAGDVEAAEADLERSLRLQEELGEELTDDPMRLAYSRRVGDAFERMIRLQVEERHDPARALAVAERQRRLSVPGGGRASRRETSPGPASEVRALLRRMPDGASLVLFSVLEDRTYVWVSREELRLLTLAVGEAELRRRIGEALGRSPRALVPWAEAGRQLYELLVRPWIHLAPPGERLVLVPDGPLYSLPFAGLLDGEGGRFLIEDRVLHVAPSAALYLDSVDRARRFAGGDGATRTLVVANPEFDHDRHPALAPLPGAEREGREIHALYGTDDGRLLLGAEASRAAFLAAAGSFERIHFAGHAVVDRRHPLESELLLAPADGDSGALTAREIFALELPRTGLVVLSACDTAVGDPTVGAGAMSLARPFLAAGVPAVVATLWRVDDDVAASLFIEFHARLLGGADPATALRDAQLELLRDEDRRAASPPGWSAFHLIGDG